MEVKVGTKVWFTDWDCQVKPGVVVMILNNSLLVERYEDNTRTELGYEEVFETERQAELAQ